MGFSNGISKPLALDPARVAQAGPRVDQIEQAVERQLDAWMKNADMMERAIDNLGDIHKWPRFCLLMAVLMDDAGRDAALAQIKSMIRAALADDALDLVMRDLGAR